MHRLFEESSEQQSARSGMTPIEAKRELVKGALQIWCWFCHPCAVREGARLHRLFEESSEQPSARSGMTPIEAKRELVKRALQMIGLDGTLLGPQKPSFE